MVFPPSSVEPREFFVPPDVHGTAALDIWRSLSANNPVPSTLRKVQRITYSDGDAQRVSEVGFLEDDGAAEWLVCAIYEPTSQSDPWCISIMRIENGQPAWRNPPIMVGSRQILGAVDFL